MPEDPEGQAFEDARAQVRWMIEQQNRQPNVFTGVKDRDLITLMDRFAGSLEFHSMLVAGQLVAEVSRRQMWDAVLERRTAMLSRMHPQRMFRRCGTRLGRRSITSGTSTSRLIPTFSGRTGQMRSGIGTGTSSSDVDIREVRPPPPARCLGAWPGAPAAPSGRGYREWG